MKRAAQKALLRHLEELLETFEPSDVLATLGDIFDVCADAGPRTDARRLNQAGDSCRLAADTARRIERLDERMVEAADILGMD